MQLAALCRFTISCILYDWLPCAWNNIQAHNAHLLELEALWTKDRSITRSTPTEDNTKETYTTYTHTDLSIYRVGFEIKVPVS
jgi:hypothetical protein